MAKLEQKEPISILKHLSCRNSSFQKETQFSQGNNVVHAAASNTDCFLLRDLCVSLTYLHRPIWKKMVLSVPWKV
jgi:hypothetical protein